MSLLSKQSKRDLILSEIEANYGEITESQEEILETLNLEIKRNVESYGMLITNKDFEDRIEKLKLAKKEIDNQIAYIEKYKEHIKSQLAIYLEDNGPQKIELEEGTKYLTVGYTTRKVIDKDLVNDNYGKFIITVDANTWKEIYGFLDSITTNYELERKILISDLPDDHPAITKYLNPQIKLVKKI